MEDSGSPVKLHRGELRLAGVLAAGLCMALLWVIAAFYPSAVPFPPTALAEALIRLMPGDLATFFIELLQDWAIRLFGIGVVIASIWFGGEVLAPHHQGRCAPALSSPERSLRSFPPPP